MRERYLPIKEQVLQRRKARKGKQAQDKQLFLLRKKLIRVLRGLITNQKYWSGDYWRNYHKKYKKENPDKRKAWRSKHKKIRNERTRRRIPAWANRSAIVLIYDKCSEWSTKLGYKLHVDHIVPLNNARVSGLHCEANLQLLADSENIAKGNSTWPDS